MTTEERKALNTISINPKNTEAYGSYAFKTPQYSSDIDLMEKVEFRGSKERAVKYLADNLQKIVANILKTPNYYFSEMKCGLDKRYNVNIGYWEIGKLKDFHRQDIKEHFSELYKKSLISRSEYMKILYLIRQQPNHEDWITLKDILRDYLVVRWNANEVVAGYKVLPAGEKLTLEQAIQDMTMIKIDMIALMNGRFIEVTNFFILEQINSKGEHILINLPQDYFDDRHFQNSILEDAEKFFHKRPINILKYTKRLWAIARTRGDNKMLKKLTPIINSDAGLLGQIRSDIDAMIILLEREKKPPIREILNELDNMKIRISKLHEIEYGNSPEIGKDEQLLYKNIDKLVHGKPKVEALIHFLNRLKNQLRNEIDANVFGYLNEHKLLSGALETIDKARVNNTLDKYLNIPASYLPERPAYHYPKILKRKSLKKMEISYDPNEVNSQLLK